MRPSGLVPKSTIKDNISVIDPAERNVPSIYTFGAQCAHLRNKKGGLLTATYLWHTGRTLGALVPKNEHHPRLDLARGEHGVERVLVVEAPRRPVEPDALGASDLRDRAAGREVAPQDGDVARALDGVRERAHDVLHGRSGRGEELRRVRDVLRERAARDGQLRAVDEARGVREEVLEQGGDAARAMQVRHVVPPGRLEVGEVRRAVGHGLEVVDREVDVCGAGHGEEVQDLRWAGE